MNQQQATHMHSRAGAVVLLESTNQLAKVLVLDEQDEIWVRLVDLAPLGDGAVQKTQGGKKRVTKDRPNASANSNYRIVRVV
jgi:hypothetical protein